MNDTVVLAESLRKGNLDLFLGVNTPYSEDLSFTPLCRDELCFMISDGLLKRRFGKEYAHLLAEETDLSQFADIPFIKSYSTSVVNSALKEYLDQRHIDLYSPYQISDTDTQISLCAKGVGAGIGPRMLLSRIHTHNRNCPEEEYIHILPVKNFNKFLQIDLVSLNYIEKPLYVQAFEEMAVRAIQKNYMAGDLVTP